MGGMAESLRPDVTAGSITFVVTLAALLVGHQLGDHVVQTDHQATDKVVAGWRGWRAMAGHLLGYHLTVAAVLLVTALALRLPVSPLGFGAGMVFSAAT